MNKTISYIIGIDEAGRGPLAGPVAVGACVVPLDFDFSIFKNLKDSKRLSEKRREEIFTQMQQMKKQRLLDYSVALVSNKVIDERAITFAIMTGIEGVLKKINLDPKIVAVKLDGGLKAPEEYIDQETLIKGDELVPAISLASIAAKVTRDRYMVKLALEHPGYGFEIHKGYGTAKHCQSIRALNICPAHRKSFTQKLVSRVRH